jgi:lysine 6-dehydrogenase
MRIIVLGGGGAMGMVTVRDLTENPLVSEVVIGEANIEQAKRVAEWTQSDKIVTRKVDITDQDSLVKAVSDVDAIANASPFHLNLHVTSAAIEACKPLTDLGGVYYMTIRQLEFDKQAREAGATIVLGSGLAPGIADVLAKYGADKLDRVDQVHIRYGEANFEPVRYKWSFRTVLEEYTQGPVILEDGELKKLHPFSGKHVFNFPSPVGEKRCCYALYSGLATLPKTIGKNVENINCAMSYSDEDEQRINVLNDLGLTKETLIDVDNAKIAPKEFLLKCVPPPDTDVTDAASVVVEVGGQAKGSFRSFRYSLVQEYHKKYRVNALAYLTGMPMSIVAQMLANGDIPKKGVLPPEVGIKPSNLFDELAKRGVKIIETSQVTSQLR